jgi:hypothetical protein
MCEISAVFCKTKMRNTAGIQSQSRYLANEVLANFLSFINNESLLSLHEALFALSSSFSSHTTPKSPRSQGPYFIAKP